MAALTGTLAPGRLIFYGPTGSAANRLGGGEAGNRKTLAILRRHFAVEVIEKPVMTGHGAAAMTAYALAFGLCMLRLIVALAGSDRRTRVHISGFYMDMVYPELFVLLLAKAFRRYVIYEMRAGGAIEAYRDRSRAYRYGFRALLDYSNRLLCQGRDYVDHFGELTANPLVHYPNFVEADIFRHAGANRQSATAPKLTYFGRLAPSKNIEFLLDIARYLKTEGFAFEFHIIGDGSPEYLRRLKETIAQDGLREVRMVHRLSGDALFSRIGDARDAFDGGHVGRPQLAQPPGL
jgi:glycosyltransferase involved in cell wall biosynthesis